MDFLIERSHEKWPQILDLCGLALTEGQDSHHISIDFSMSLSMSLFHSSPKYQYYKSSNIYGYGIESLVDLGAQDKMFGSCE